jgi:AcrR family transcriptional regulator
MAQARQRYHHGQVPDAALAAALALVDEAGAESVTMRAVAARLGVDHRTLYRHFEDRGALLAAAAASGHRALLRQLKAEASDGVNPLRNDFAAYVRFALARPHLHVLMLSCSRSFIEAYPPLDQALKDVLTHLMASSKQALAARGLADQTEVARDVVFAALGAGYGLITLAESQTLSPRTPEQLEAFLVGHVLSVIEGQLVRLGAGCA